MRRMISAVEMFIGLRYLRAKRRTRFVSFITGISLLGIALGVAALITILSVMNGFESELRDRLLSMSAHGAIIADDGKMANWSDAVERVSREPGVAAAAPYVEMEGMIRAGNRLHAVMVNGIIPEREERVLDASIRLIHGNLGSLQAGKHRIILGQTLAFNLGILFDETGAILPNQGVVLLIPRPTAGGDLQPILERFVVVDVFVAGLQEHDGLLALVHASDASDLLGIGEAVTGIRFRANDVFAAPQLAKQLQTEFGPGVHATDWSIQNASYFHAIGLEKMMMSLILSLIIAVAAFNIVASLVMVVTDKTTDIAILRTLGLSPSGVVKVFFVQGAVIGWLGVLLGVALGVSLALNVATIVPALEQFFGFQIMPGEVYYVTAIPSELHWIDVAVIGVAAFLLTSLATLYPSRRAANVNPALALRYE